MNFGINGFKYFTSEAVLPGHPDKIADQISDLIVDIYLKEDGHARTAIETLVTHKKIIIAGEVHGPKISTQTIEDHVRELIKNIGYSADLLNSETIEIINLLHEQSYEIALGVDFATKKGAGDQGIMFGYATDETLNFMPAPLHFANEILKNIITNNRNLIHPLGPDGKSQITIKYEDAKAIAAENIVVSVQHHKELCQKEIQEIIYPIIARTIPWAVEKESIFINPTGLFTKGGPISDCGLTGRKIVVDSYGGMIQNGGGAFSGKDPTKVDRSAAYMARYLAKNIVASGLARHCNIQLCYAIGIDHPLSFQVNIQSSSIMQQESSTKRHIELQEKITKFIKENIDLSPYGIIKHLELNNPIYLPTATYGHFGRDPNAIKGAGIIEASKFFTWEKLDLVAPLKALNF